MKPINIFSTVAKYTCESKYAQRENLHTAFFAYTLNRDKNLLKYLLKRLLENRSKLLDSIKEKDFIIEIQEQDALERKKPDMTISTMNENLTIYIENKIASPEGKYSDGEKEESQLNRYLKLARNNPSDEKFVLYITKNYEDINQDTEEHQNFGGQFTWSEISDFIEEYINQSNSESEKNDITRQFLKYMEEYDLRGTKGFKKEYGEVWRNYVEFEEIRDEYINEIRNEIKQRFYKKYTTISKPEKYEDDDKGIYYYIYIYKKNWNTKKYDGFWISIGFGMDFEKEKESEQTPIILTVELSCYKKFSDSIKNKFKRDLERAEEDLKKVNFVKVNEQINFSRYIYLKNITKDYCASKKEQIKNITDWVLYAVDDLENSGLLKLLEKNDSSS